MSKILNILYYITSGIKHQRLYNGKMFYINYPIKVLQKNINIELIKEIIAKDQIDTSIIDDYRYYNTKKNAFIKIKDSFPIPLDSNELTLQIHIGKQKNQNLFEIEAEYNKMLSKFKELEEKKIIMNINSRNDNIDLYFLYASPILKNKKEEEFKPINYRLEIRNLVYIFEKSKKEYNCFFECANEKKFREAIIKQPKILHISSHGLFDEKREYSLFLEEKGILQAIHQEKLERILSSVKNQLKNIDLVFASTCYSETLGELFLKYGINNVIYIQGKNPISDKAAVKFSQNFYNELIKGNTISDAFDKSKKLIQSDKEKDYFQLKKCCCSHWHKSKKDCPLKRDEQNFHNKYHIKCDCDFEEYNIHEKDCKILQIIKDNNVEENFYFEEYLNNTIKICCICCKPADDSKEKMLPHEESFKFILKQKNLRDNKIIFRFKKEGKLNKNKNCYIMNEKDKFKKCSIVGRRLQVKEIYDTIDNDNINNIHFIIIFGAYEVGKQNFAESVCIYLFERKIINGYWMIEIIEINELKKKVMELTNNGKNNEGNYILVIKINYYLENPIELLNEILNERSILNNNFYYIILISTQDNKICNIECEEIKYKIIYLKNLNLNSATQLLKDVCESYGYSFNLNNLKDHLEDLIELTGYSRKKINDLAELIGKYNNYEKLKEILQAQDFNNASNFQNEIRLLLEKDISKIYCLLSLMSFGLPESMLSLFEPNFKIIIKKEDEEKLIYQEPNYNWYTIIDKKYKKDISEVMQDKKKECICKCLEIYAKLLFYYIQKTKKYICHPDSNIHYNFNSYSDKGIWRTFDFKIYEYYFLKEDKSKDYKNILEKDFVLEKHSENIYNLIEKNIGIIKSLVFNDNNVQQKEYINQILLMLPSIYISEKYSNFKNIISKCIYLCDKLKDPEWDDFLNSKQRLNLFLLSKKDNPYLNLEEFNLLGEQGMADAHFIIGLKQKNIKSLLTAIDKYKEINDKDLKIQIPYTYYEIGCIYFSKKKYNPAEYYLKKGLNSTNIYNDNFINYKIYIELALVMEEEYHRKEQYESYLKKVVNECLALPLINEANSLINKFKKNLEPDIVMLNSNPLKKNNNFSALHNGIFAYLNNQYYILQKITTNLKRDIRIKSIVLNEENLKEAFNEKGKILIIQSDDFNKEGEIILESNYGLSEALPKNKLKELLPKKLNYEVVLLCFIKSEKLIDLFKGKVKFLITFDDINLDSIEFDMLFKYNELSIDFIIHFIKNTTCSSIMQSYEDSLQTFRAGLENYKKSELELINKEGNIITLNKFEEETNTTIIIKQKGQNKEKGEIIYVYPLLQMPNVELHNKIYSDDILSLLKLILISRDHIINIYGKNDAPSKEENLNIKTIICFEIMRFLYRHQAFNGKILYVSNPKKLGASLLEITNNLIGEKKRNSTKEKENIIENIEFSFVVINNFEKAYKIQGKEGKKYFFDNIPENFQYLIISKSPLEKAHTYEIKIKNEENHDKNGNKDHIKKNKKNKNKIKKITSKKNNINNNNKYNSGENGSKEKNNINNIIPLNKKKNSDKKEENKNNKKLKIPRNDRQLEFSILNNKSSSDSSDNSNSYLSEDSD